jgi:hypothetical protein
MDQLIFHKPNKKVRSEKKMDHLTPQTKHTPRVLLLTLNWILNYTPVNFRMLLMNMAKKTRDS